MNVLVAFVRMAAEQKVRRMDQATRTAQAPDEPNLKAAVSGSTTKHVSISIRKVPTTSGLTTSSLIALTTEEHSECSAIDVFTQERLG